MGKNKKDRNKGDGLGLVGGKSPADLIKERFTVSVNYVDGTSEIYNNVINFGPIPTNNQLLLIHSEDGETICIPFYNNIKNYKYIPNKPVEEEK